MKTFKLLKVSENYDEVIVEAETLEEAKELAEDLEWETDEPQLIKEAYKEVESSGDIDADEEELDEEDWIVEWDAYERDE